jgi:hypothetical protein
VDLRYVHGENGQAGWFDTLFLASL